MNTFGKILEKNGTDAVFTDRKGRHSLKVFIVPEKMGFSDESRTYTGELGTSDDSRYLMFFSGIFEFDGCKNTEVFAEDRGYEFINCELFRVNGKPSHYEALIKLREETEL